MNETCVFCGIAKDSSQASSVYEDDFVMAFLDNRPASDGHILRGDAWVMLQFVYKKKR
jgi:diadenosine tetraphosphate (Ap4A) HIT family hydrolase